MTDTTPIQVNLSLRGNAEPAKVNSLKKHLKSLVKAAAGVAADIAVTEVQR